MASATGLDRRWIFLIMGLIVVGLFVLDKGEEIPVSEYVQKYYDTIEELPEGTIVMLSADFDPASMAELLPSYQGTIHQLLRNNLRVINVSTWPAASPYTRAEFDRIAPQYDKLYGVDWVELGFKPGDDVGMGQIGQSVRSAYPNDERNNQPISELPLLDEVSPGFGGIPLLITMSAGYPGILEWIAQAGARYGVTILTGTTAVQTPDLFAYYPSQLAGFLGAATGATQYLQLVAVETEDVHEALHDNQARMFIQSWAHIFILLLILVGNVLYFVNKRRAA